MARKFVILSLFFLSFSSLLFGKGEDSLRFARMDVKLEEYCAAMIGESVEKQQLECDFLIGECKDSLLRRHVALKLYDYYMSSHVMGVEAVAIHLIDKWFASGKLRMGSAVDLLNARVFADFNRNTLLGMDAPQVKLASAVGDSVLLFGKTGRFALVSDRCRVLLFYDVSCAK